jgi:hypothetical protein
MFAASRQHRHARGIHGHPRIGETGPNRVEILELALMRLRLRNLGHGGLNLLCMAPRSLPQGIEPGVERCALGLGAGLRTTGGGEVRFGLTSCIAGLPVGLIEVRQALDPDLMRLTRGGAFASASAASADSADRRFFCSRRRAVPDTASAAPTANPSQRQRSPSRLTRR